MLSPGGHRNTEASHRETDILGFNTSNGTYFFTPGQIIRCEAMSNYTRLYFTDQKELLVAKTLGEYETSLPARHFLRIHRSDIINISYIKRHDHLGNLWLTDGTKLTVSKRRKTRVIEALRSFIL